MALSFAGGLMDLPDELLPNVVDQLCGGAGEGYDLTLWRHACKLAQTCSTWSRLVCSSDHCEGVLFRSEYVGPDVMEGDDPHKVATLSLSRGIWHYAPRVTAEFTYGGVSTLHRAVPAYVHSLVIKVPLLVEDVLRVFHKPPGWQAAAKLTLSGKSAPPWSGCFPTDKYPEPPVRVRMCGPVEAKYTCELLEPVVDARGQRWYDESTAELTLPAGVHVNATCSTGLEEFKRGTRAHYIDELELGLVGVFVPEFLELATVRNFLNELEISPEFPPELSYRFETHEARMLAGYPCNNRAALYDLVHPPKPRKQKLRKMRALDSDSEEEEWDPDLRRRQKEAARAATQAQLADMRRGESFHTEGADHILPARRGTPSANEVPEPPDPEPYPPPSAPIPGSAIDTMLKQQQMAGSSFAPIGEGPNEEGVSSDDEQPVRPIRNGTYAAWRLRDSDSEDDSDKQSSDEEDQWPALPVEKAAGKAPKPRQQVALSVAERRARKAAQGRDMFLDSLIGGGRARR